MENSETNQEIINIWKRNFEKVKEYSGGKCFWPVLSPNFVKNTILFLGINPSGEKDEELIINDNLILKDHDKINLQIKLEEYNIKRGGYKKYFKEFEKISEIIFRRKDNFDHFDIYFFRLRDSKKFMDILKKDKDTPFFKDQLKHSINTIKNIISPKIIFVANKNASKIIEKELDLSWLDDKGFYVAHIKNRKVPVFLSGMISSTRSIDDYTLKRLCWHIKRAIKWYDQNNKQNGTN